MDPQKLDRIADSIDMMGDEITHSLRHNRQITSILHDISASLHVIANAVSAGASNDSDVKRHEPIDEMTKLVRESMDEAIQETMNELEELRRGHGTEPKNGSVFNRK